MRYQWNQPVSKELTGRLSPAGDQEHKVTLACGAVGYEWTEFHAQQDAEMSWEDTKTPNPFVTYLGSPRHVEIVGLSRDDVLERVPSAKI